MCAADEDIGTRAAVQDVGFTAAVEPVVALITRQLVDTRTAPPYSFDLTQLATGGHTIQAKATDGINVADTTINVTVQAGAPPPNPNPPNPQDPGDDTDGDGNADIITGGCQTGAGGGGGLGALGGLGFALMALRARRRR